MIALLENLRTLFKSTAESKTATNASVVRAKSFYLREQREADRLKGELLKLQASLTPEQGASGKR